MEGLREKEVSCRVLRDACFLVDCFLTDLFLYTEIWEAGIADSPISASFGSTFSIKQGMSIWESGGGMWLVADYFRGDLRRWGSVGADMRPSWVKGVSLPYLSSDGRAFPSISQLDCFDPPLLRTEVLPVTSESSWFVAPRFEETRAWWPTLSPI